MEFPWLIERLKIRKSGKPEWLAVLNLGMDV